MLSPPELHLQTYEPVGRIGRCGFTLIEVLVVVSIIVMLMAMVMPVLGVIQRSMRRSNTENVLRKTDVALRMFRTDWGAYPYQASYPDPVPSTGFTNRLYYRIGTDISWSGSPSVAELVKADATTAASKYDDASPSSVTYRTSDLWTSSVAHAARLNASAREQARIAVLSGNLGMRGPVITTTTGTTTTDRRGIGVLTAGEQTSSGNPGWARDYIEGDIEKRFVRGEDIVDAWGQPLIYINQTLPGVKTSMYKYVGGSTKQYQFGPIRFGLGTLGFDPLTGPAPAIVSAGRAQLLYMGRIRLSEGDAGDGNPTPVDATWFPDATNLRHSDMRYYAAPGFESEFELWSSGPNKGFAYMRDDAVNTDNLALVNYEREIR